MRRLQSPFMTDIAFSFFSRNYYHRRRTSYKSRPLFVPSREPLPLLRGNLYNTIWRYKNHILYHAEWRVKLFLLLCIAYYKMGYYITVGSTEIQHGIGNADYDLQACHSSFFPRVVDISPKIEFISTSSIIDHTKFNHINNMTVCAPALVNQVDLFFTGRQGNSIYRKYALSILNQVSNGKYDPFVGLGYFLKVMDCAFSNRDAFIRQEPNRYRRRAFKSIFGLQRKGTFDRTTYSDTLIPRKSFWNEFLERRRYETDEKMFKRVQKEMLKHKYERKTENKSRPFHRGY